MSSEFVLIFWAVLFFTAIFFAWFFLHRPKEKERMLIIQKSFEKDLDPSKVLESPYFQKSNRQFSFSFPWLKIGLVIAFLSLGGLVENIVTQVYWSDIRYDAPVITFLFGGIGLILAHFFDKNHDA